LEGIRKVADAEGYHLLVMETDYNSVEFDDFTKLVMSKQTDGIILLSTLSPFKESHSHADGIHPPIVLGLEGIAKELSQYPCVCIDNEAAAFDATQYLIGLGHRDIGFIHGTIGFLYGLPTMDCEWTKARADGFYKAMSANKIPVNEDWVFTAPMGLKGGRQAAKQLLTLDSRPSALFCSNDELALGALFELKQGGLRVPEDISLMGLDNMLYGEISTPPLTTIEQPAELIGERTMRRLLKLIAGEASGDNIEILPHHLVERESCMAFKK
jgi:LacI family repressor for deo operon, udp, cdd, tsx, nupC, and nupG